MKHFSKILIASLVFFTSTYSIQAQPVSFTANSTLNSISGNGYEDCVVDMNGDNLDDVVRVTSGHVYVDFQQPDGSFVQSDRAMSISNYPSWSLAAADIDENGFTDLLFGSGNRVSFMYATNDGQSFTEDFHSDYIFAQRSTFADIDNDGNLDAFVCHDVDQSHPYRNDGTGVLTLDQSLIQTVDMAGNYAAIWVDYDNDADTDLYVTKCRQGSSSGDPERTNRLYRNNGDGTYSEVAEECNMDDNAQSWATSFEDFDNDGDFDAFIVNHDFQNRFMENDGAGNFTDIIATTGINGNDLGAWENAAADFNNDGFVDIFSELGSELYVNNGDMTFTGQNLSFNDGGIGDLNNDGFLDVVKGNTIWMNDGNTNNWIKINTKGIISNSNGIGARVEIHGSWGTQIREVRSGQSFSPMSSLLTHFGIGVADSIYQVVVKWPSGVITTIDDPDINTTHTIAEAACTLAPTTLVVDGSPEICEGSAVMITAPASDGSTFVWSNGETTQSIMAAEEGNYSATIFDDADCVSLSDHVTISFLEEIIPEITAQSSTELCEGESVVLIASGGSNYSWSNGQTGFSILVDQTGVYTVSIDGICVSQVASEPIEVSISDAPEPDSDDVTLPGPGTTTLSALGENIEWFDVATGGVPIETGSDYLTPFLEETTTYYVQSTTVYSDFQDGGKPNFDGGGGIPGTGAYSYFDVWEEFVLESVRVLVPESVGAGFRTIQLVDGNDNVLEEVNIFIELGEHVLTLNWNVPLGAGLSLRCPQNNLFRNNDGVTYPYSIGDVGSITTSFYGEQYYYYFYDWKIVTGGLECTSDRIPVTVTVLTTGVNDLVGVSGLEVFPNPATDRLNVSFNADETDPIQVQLFDVLGRYIQGTTWDNITPGMNNETLYLQDIPTGVYTLKFTVGERSAGVKIVVE